MQCQKITKKEKVKKGDLDIFNLKDEYSLYLYGENIRIHIGDSEGYQILFTKKHPELELLSDEYWSLIRKKPRD